MFKKNLGQVFISHPILVAKVSKPILNNSFFWILFILLSS